VTALRTRIITRFGELEAGRADINKQLTALAKAPAFLEDPTLLDTLPALAGVFTNAPQRLQAQLLQALDLQLIYKKDTHQVTIYATFTPATPHALAAIINTSEPPTSSGNVHPLAQHHRVSWLVQPRQTRPGVTRPGRRIWPRSHSSPGPGREVPDDHESTGGGRAASPHHKPRAVGAAQIVAQPASPVTPAPSPTRNRGSPAVGP
jgi:hypothetical protein